MKQILMILLTLVSSFHLATAQLPFTRISAPFPPLGYSFAAWGDFDNDGDLDVLVCGALANDSLVTQIFRNDNGVFTDIHAGLPGFRLSSAEWGDYDNDGDLDLLITGDDTNSVPHTIIFRNDNGTFSDSGIALPGIDDGQAIWGDYDNDGDLDILLAGSFIAKIFRNDGNSVFTDINAPLPAVQTAIVAWGDYNNDGWLDALVGGDTGGGMVTKLFKNTAGSFKADTISLPGLASGMAKWADLDKDGRSDLLLDGMDDNTTGFFLIFKNDGDGHLTKIEGYSFPHAYSSMDIGDYDNDGFPDIVLIGKIQGCGGAALTVLYHNEGYMVFTQVDTFMDGFSFGSAGWGDYNNDGYSDLLFTGIDNIAAPNTEIYRNAAGDSLFHSNTQPEHPNGLFAYTSGSDVTLTWNRGNDNETARDGLSYNLFVGKSPVTAEVLSPMSEPATGYLLKPCTGNTGMDTTWTIHGLENGTYYWSVQSVDNGFLGSVFADVQSFTLTTSGIENLSSKELKIFPNPAKDNISISGRSGIYKLINSTGVRVAEGLFSGDMIDVSGLQKGLYLIQITEGGNNFSGKFVKE